MNNYAKIIIRNDFKKKDGTFPIYLRITFDRKPKPISLNKSVPKKYWNEKEGLMDEIYPEGREINRVLKSHLKRANDIIYNYEINNKVLTYDDFIKEFKREEGNSYPTYVKSILDKNPKTGFYGEETLRIQYAELSKLKKYKSSVLFSDITVSFLQGYESYMRNKLGNKINTIHKTLKIIRSHINRAIFDGLIEENIFEKYKLKTEKSRREFLSESELKSLVKLLETELPEYQMNALRIFLFSCYTGLRYGDIKRLKFDNINEGFIRIVMHKTKKNVSIPLNEQAKALIILNNETNKIFKVPTNQVLNRFIKEVIKKAEIKKSISFHCSRHTFATMSITLGIPVEVVSKFLGHNDLKTTQIYAKVVDSLKIKEMEKWNDLV